MKRTRWVIVLLALLIFASTAHSSRVAQLFAGRVHANAADIRQETFEIVWRTVKEKHFDPTLGGLDWDKVREQYEPRAAAAKTDREFYDVLRQMLGELHQSHFNIIPPEAIVEDNSPEPKGGGIGVDVRLIDGQAIITRIEPGSRGASAGLRPGFIIKAVDDSTVEQVVSMFAKSKESQAITTTRITRALLARINGAPETPLRVTYLDESDQQHQLTVTRERLKGEMSPRFGNFPPQYTEFETRRLADGVGYIRFNIFVTLLMDRIRAAIRALSDAPGIVIDLRGNPGGLGGMAPGIAGLLEAKETSIGEMKLRSSSQKFIAFPQPNPYLGTVVILVDGGSASTSEIFAAGLQEIGRATIVGERTMGAALPSIFGKLPTGAIFQYAIGDFKTPKGTLIEGLGVKPDIEVKLTRRALFEGRDPQLDAAVGIINRKHSKQERAATGR